MTIQHWTGKRLLHSIFSFQISPFSFSSKMEVVNPTPAFKVKSLLGQGTFGRAFLAMPVVQQQDSLTGSSSNPFSEHPMVVVRIQGYQYLSPFPIALSFPSSTGLACFPAAVSPRRSRTQSSRTQSGCTRSAPFRWRQQRMAQFLLSMASESVHAL